MLMLVFALILMMQILLRGFVVGAARGDLDAVRRRVL
ncbi:hypothetical protein A2U01_0115299, partial [Trifolium medium]|nr:hypothetical protein [Trifolium medium]